MEMLLDNHLIDLQSLILLNYKRLDINESEAIVLMLVVYLENQKCAINVDVLEKYMNLPKKTIDQLVRSLLDRDYLCIEGYQISSRPLINYLLNRKEDQNEEKKTLVEVFEAEFNRPLSGIEIDTLKQWKQCFYSDEMIIDALREATLSNVKNFRYIGKILTDWAKHGVKKSGQGTDQINDQIDLVDYDFLSDLI